MDLQKKVGPLPAWGWAVGAVGVAGLVVILKRRSSAKMQAAAATATAQGSSGTTGSSAMSDVPSSTSGMVGAGQPSYYYVNSAPAASSPANTATQSQLNAQAAFQAHLASLEDFYRQLGIQEYSTTAATSRGDQRTVTDSAAIQNTIKGQIAAVQSQIQQDLQGVMIPAAAATGTTTTPAAGS